MVDKVELLPPVEKPKAAPAAAKSFADLTEAICAEQRLVVRLWHPEPEGKLYTLPNGVNVEVNEGVAAYQLTTGEVVTDF